MDDTASLKCVIKVRMDLIRQIVVAWLVLKPHSHSKQSILQSPAIGPALCLLLRSLSFLVTEHNLNCRHFHTKQFDSQQNNLRWSCKPYYKITIKTFTARCSPAMPVSSPAGSRNVAIATAAASKQYCFIMHSLSALLLQLTIQWKSFQIANKHATRRPIGGIFLTSDIKIVHLENLVIVWLVTIVR